MISELIPGTRIKKRDLSFGGYRRDLRGNFDKIKQVLGFIPQHKVRDGIIEVRDAIMSGLIRDPGTEFHHNARFPVL